MAILEAAAGIARVREQLQSIEPPYLLRKFEATPQDYEDLVDEDLRCEYADGVLIVHSPASLVHEGRLSFLGTIVNGYVTSRDLGRVYTSNAVMQLQHRRFCPDLSFLANE